jgi:hypothetical protein
MEGAGFLEFICVRLPGEWQYDDDWMGRERRVGLAALGEGKGVPDQFAL